MAFAASPAADAGERLAGPFAATVERVIDGDSLAVRVKIWLGLDVSTIVRLRGIDAPELSARCPEERRRALAAREGLAALVAGGDISLAAVETDKYGGRVVADVADAAGRPLAATLVGAGLARPYDGGRRGGWCG
jgi:endonuclease YncB( thermonuclease family)